MSISKGELARRRAIVKVYLIAFFLLIFAVIFGSIIAGVLDAHQ